MKKKMIAFVITVLLGTSAMAVSNDLSISAYKSNRSSHVLLSTEKLFCGTLSEEIPAQHT